MDEVHSIRFPSDNMRQADAISRGAKISEEVRQHWKHIQEQLSASEFLG